MAGTPLLGICVGMQLMAERGLEHAVTPGYGWIKGDVAEMKPQEIAIAEQAFREARKRSADGGNHPTNLCRFLPISDGEQALGLADV